MELKTQKLIGHYLYNIPIHYFLMVFVSGPFRTQKYLYKFVCVSSPKKLFFNAFNFKLVSVHAGT